MSVPDHTIVPYDPEAHAAFVRASWCKDTRLPWRRLNDVIRRPEARCVVAHDPEDPDTLYGWAASYSGQLVWAYVRAAGGMLRNRGLGRKLIENTFGWPDRYPLDLTPMLPLLRRGVRKK